MGVPLLHFFLKSKVLRTLYLGLDLSDTGADFLFGVLPKDTLERASLSTCFGGLGMDVVMRNEEVVGTGPLCVGPSALSLKGSRS